MSFCHRCGQKMPEDAAFCPFCGASLSASAGVSAPVSVSAPSPAPVPVPPADPAPAAAAKKKKRWIWVPVLLLVLALAAGGVLARQVNTLSSPAEVDIGSFCQSVLYLECFDPDGNMVASGSGFLIEDGTTLVTNYHVIRDASHVVAWSSDYTLSTSADILLVSDRTADLALLQCETDLGLPPLVMENSDTVQQGDVIYAIGYPLGLGNTLSDGVVSSRYLEEGNIQTIQVTAPISHGSSGGALLNKNGRVVGVTTAFFSDGQNLNLAVASNHVFKQLERNSKAKPLLDHYRAIEHPAYYSFIDEFDINSYTPVSMAALYASPEKFDGMYVAIEGYVTYYAQEEREDFRLTSSRKADPYELDCFDQSCSINRIKPSPLYPSTLYGKFSSEHNILVSHFSHLIDGYFYLHALDCYISP